MRFRLLPILCLLVIAYFSYHSVWGNRGFIRMQEIQSQIAEARQMLQETEQIKNRLQHKTDALKNPRAIDADILEEEALRVLGQTHTENLVIFD